MEILAKVDPTQLMLVAFLSMCGIAFLAGLWVLFIKGDKQ
jgi:hypothetical protein